MTDFLQSAGVIVVAVGVIYLAIVQRRLARASEIRIETMRQIASFAASRAVVRHKHGSHGFLRHTFTKDL